MSSSTQLQQLRDALEAHRQTLQELDAALAHYEGNFQEQAAAISDGANGRAPQLLSPDEVCEALGMGKSWTYRKLKSGEIPSVKLGRSIKVKREDLEEYLENHRYSPSAENTE